jgi:hypothetical protein
MVLPSKPIRRPLSERDNEPDAPARDFEEFPRWFRIVVQAETNSCAGLRDMPTRLQITTELCQSLIFETGIHNCHGMSQSSRFMAVHWR